MGRLSTVDLLVVTSLDQHLLIFLNMIYLFSKQDTLMMRSNVLSLPTQFAFPGFFDIKAHLNVRLRRAIWHCDFAIQNAYFAS